MRYTLETEKNKLKKDGTGKNTCYYVTGWDGSRGVMSKDWVVKNIDNISNASVSGGEIYLINDKFEKAKRIILLDLISQINNRGFDAKEAYRTATYEREMSKTTQLPARATTNQAWDFIAHYGTDQSKIFQELFNQAIKEINDTGKTVWMIHLGDKVTISTKKSDGAVEVTHNIELV